MTDNVAILAGYTEEYYASNDRGDELDLLCFPGTHKDGFFKAWDMYGQEYIQIKGWLWSCELVKSHGKAYRGK